MTEPELTKWVLGLFSSALGAILLYLLKTISEVKSLSIKNESTAKNLSLQVEKNDAVVDKVEAKCADHISLLKAHDLTISSHDSMLRELKHTLTDVIKEIQDDRRHNEEAYMKSNEEIAKKLNTLIYRLTEKKDS